MRFLRLSLLLCSCLALPAQVAPENHFFDSDGVRIRYVDLGHGEPIVLIHGFSGRAEGWNQGGILSSLAKDYRVIALDCRGHGMSDKPHEPEMYGSRMADDVLRLMDHLGIRRAHVVGYSMGAFITGHLLAKHSGRMITATLGGGAPPRGWREADAQWAQGLSDLVRSYSGNDAGNQDRLALMAIPPTWEGLRVSDQELAEARVPTLAIVGSEDPRARERLRSLKELLPSLQLVVIDGATHTGERAALRSPEFLRSLGGFIGRNPGSD